MYSKVVTISTGPLQNCRMIGTPRESVLLLVSCEFHCLGGYTVSRELVPNRCLPLEGGGGGIYVSGEPVLTSAGLQDGAGYCKCTYRVSVLIWYQPSWDGDTCRYLQGVSANISPLKVGVGTLGNQLSLPFRQ